MQIAIKIDVNTLRGTREGAPRLVEMLKRHGLAATFFFSLGADRSGRGIFGNTPRVSQLEHFGFKTLCYGTLLPSPDIAAHCADILRDVRDAGFEVGMRSNENIRWRDHVMQATPEWTKRDMDLGVLRFTEIFGEAPKAHAAAGWQMNRDALRMTQRLGFDYSSDTRGSHPFIPTWDAEIVTCPQLPTTLPTLDELIGRSSITPENVAQHLLEISEKSLTSGHVFNVSAELEGGKWLAIFENILLAWQTRGYQLVSMREYWQTVKSDLPRHEVKIGEVDGRKGALAIQGQH
ncbi:MAG: polysaccharide deacetylase family protein [Gallionellaceae bacterium]|jgi:peptidoglycan/xylan/chitin deacetylase (PgdA/CDA1 family)